MRQGPDGKLASCESAIEPFSVTTGSVDENV